MTSLISSFYLRNKWMYCKVNGIFLVSVWFVLICTIEFILDMSTPCLKISYIRHSSDLPYSSASILNPLILFRIFYSILLKNYCYNLQLCFFSDSRQSEKYNRDDDEGGMFPELQTKLAEELSTILDRYSSLTCIMCTPRQITSM